MTLVLPVYAVGFVSTSTAVMRNCFVMALADDQVKIWDAQRRKSQRQN